MREDWRHGGFGLYVHWPFCAAKCPYCDFNSHVTASIDMDTWQKAYLTALAFYGMSTPDRVLNSVYFGGGTPSLMDPAIVGAILDSLSRYWHLANDLEVTLEANPSSVEAGRFSQYRAAGVNRVSLGVQALNDPDLRALGRLHDVSQALNALDIAKTTFDRVSFDLIYGRQDQTLTAWEGELRLALAFEPEHLSLYQLTIEDGTAFGDRFKRGLLRGLPGEDLSADMFFLTQEMCAEAGLPAYEVSNHAKEGQESRHNLIYWRGGDYVGIGPGAHGRLTLDGTRYETTTALAPNAWLAASNQGNGGEENRRGLSPSDHAGEYLMMSLRTGQGTDLLRYASILGASLDSDRISHLRSIGLVTVEDHHLIATPTGRPVLNAVIAELLPD
ncbi:MAG TPA: coproporphyrinogen III oxidase [Rhodobacterales bacterium]|nr:coproporphyrinogen III oxidase [Rhodobacterales bacterium]